MAAWRGEVGVQTLGFRVRHAEKLLVLTCNRGQEGAGASSDELGLQRLHGDQTVGDRRGSSSLYGVKVARSALESIFRASGRRGSEPNFRLFMM